MTTVDGLPAHVPLGHAIAVWWRRRESPHAQRAGHDVHRIGDSGAHASWQSH
jgi:hypothetical protein